jgi:hypothetical protein
MATAIADSSTLTRLASEEASGLVARRANLRAGIRDALQSLARLLLRLELVAKAETSAGSPANSTVRVTRLPGWINCVAGMSAM